MELFPNPFLSTGRIKESFEIFTYLARNGDQNSFICPLIQSIFVDHLVNVKHYPQGVTIHRGKPTRESVISVPKWENTECFQAVWRGIPASLGEHLSFFRQLQSLDPPLSPAPQSRCTGDCGVQVLRGPATFAIIYQNQMVLLVNLVSTWLAFSSLI